MSRFVRWFAAFPGSVVTLHSIMLGTIASAAGQRSTPCFI